MIRISKLFYPQFKYDLLRLGKNFDGGYIVEKNSILSSQILLSFGVADDWSFEKDFSELGGKKIYSYDYSVNKKFWFKNFLRSCLNILYFKDLKKNFHKLFEYFRFKSFFDSKNNFHLKKFIVSSDMKKNIFNNDINISLNDILKNMEKNIFLKIDIEGSEYRILDEIIKNHYKINGLVIEFHDFDLHYDKVKKFISELNFNLVHLHVNNFGSINNDGLPSVIELSFASSNFLQYKSKNDRSYPYEKLDMPNNKELADHKIFFY